ncbi:MAG: GNAT family N-acetyltransferase [Chloroflexota bacterium]|nr:GNAT family N-acetyltransferase [Chloroflexota bacterium]
MEIDIGGGYRLRPWRAGDEASLAKYANNHKVWRNMRDSFPHPYTLEDARAWLTKREGQQPENVFAIATATEAVGGIGLHPQTDIDRRTAEVGYWLGEPFWGRGIATRAVRALVPYAFANFDLARLQAHVFEWNPASARVLEKAGFTLEARLRKAVTKDGQTIDMFQYALVREG